MKIRIIKDCLCAADEHELTHYYRDSFKPKPKLKAGDEFLFDGEEYLNFYGRFFVVKTPAGTYHVKPENVEITGSVPVWVAVDSSGQEAKHFSFKPERHVEHIFCPGFPGQKTICYWSSNQTPRTVMLKNTVWPFVYKREDLEPGTIEKLTGKKMTIADEPVQIE